MLLKAQAKAQYMLKNIAAAQQILGSPSLIPGSIDPST